MYVDVPLLKPSQVVWVMSWFLYLDPTSLKWVVLDQKNDGLYSKRSYYHVVLIAEPNCVCKKVVIKVTKDTKLRDLTVCKKVVIKVTKDTKLRDLTVCKKGIIKATKDTKLRDLTVCKKVVIKVTKDTKLRDLTVCKIRII